MYRDHGCKGGGGGGESWKCVKVSVAGCGGTKSLLHTVVLIIILA